MVNTLDFGGVRTALVFREARTECIRDFCHKSHKQPSKQLPPRPNATSKYFSWDIPGSAAGRLPNPALTSAPPPNKKRKPAARPSQYYTSLEVSEVGKGMSQSHIVNRHFGGKM